MLVENAKNNSQYAQARASRDDDQQSRSRLIELKCNEGREFMLNLNQILLSISKIKNWLQIATKLQIATERKASQDVGPPPSLVRFPSRSGRG
jgi:hypothetical protein